MNASTARESGALIVWASTRSWRLTGPTAARITPISRASSSFESASSAPMVSALITSPSSERVTSIRETSSRISRSIASRSPRTTRSGEPAMTPSSPGAATFTPEAATTDFTRSNRSSVRISFIGRGFRSDFTFVWTTPSVVASITWSPTVSVPSKRITSRVMPSPRSSFTSSTVPWPGPWTWTASASPM